MTRVFIEDYKILCICTGYIDLFDDRIYPEANVRSRLEAIKKWRIGLWEHVGSISKAVKGGTCM